MAAEQLAIADDAFALGADVDEDLVLVDADDGAVDDVAVLEALDVRVLLGEELLHRGRLGAELADGAGSSSSAAAGASAASSALITLVRRGGSAAGSDGALGGGGFGGRLGGSGVGRGRLGGRCSATASAAGASARRARRSAAAGPRRPPATGSGSARRPRAPALRPGSRRRPRRLQGLDRRTLRGRPARWRARRRWSPRRRSLASLRRWRRSPPAAARSRPLCLRSTDGCSCHGFGPRITNGPSNAQAVSHPIKWSVVIDSAVRSFVRDWLARRSSAVGGPEGRESLAHGF